MQEFKIKAYGRTELAQLYSPNISPYAAYRKLMGWCKMNPELRHLCDQRQRSFTPAQVQLMVSILGEP